MGGEEEEEEEEGGNKKNGFLDGNKVSSLEIDLSITSLGTRGWYPLPALSA